MFVTCIRCGEITYNRTNTFRENLRVVLAATGHDPSRNPDNGMCPSCRTTVMNGLARKQGSKK